MLGKLTADRKKYSTASSAHYVQRCIVQKLWELHRGSGRRSKKILNFPLMGQPWVSLHLPSILCSETGSAMNDPILVSVLLCSGL